MPAGKPLWEPDSERKKSAKITKYSDWLSANGKDFGSYPELWQWSVDDIEGFWGSVWEYFGVSADEMYSRPLETRSMPGAKWFPGARLNLARHVLEGRHEGTAIVAANEGGDEKSLSWEGLRKQTAALAANLKESGVVRGDTVAAYLPNSIEAVVGFLASASIGAAWTSCSPEFGAQAVLDRLVQTRPKALFAVEKHLYGGKAFDREEAVDSIVRGLPSLKQVTIVAGRGRAGGAIERVPWEQMVSGKEKLEFESVPFDHPLWTVYSSGTTGLPKPIVHGQGGVLLEHLKELSLHNDIGPEDRFFWFTTTGWMMWNYLVGGLLHGATLVLYDGSPGTPDMNALWDLAERSRVTFLGVSAAYASACIKAGVDPRSTHDLSELRGIGSTGSPLSPDGFEWVYSKVKQDVWLASLSGGTDVCTAFVGGNPTLPVYTGEIQCRCLGAKVEAFNEEGRAVLGEVGELVITEPMPSMPLYFMNDPGRKRELESYFDTFPGVWRHGDWIKITERGACIIYGRSDATIKKQGVRIGTSEIYRAIEALSEVTDSLVLDLVHQDRSEMLLFVVIGEGRELDVGLEDRIRSKIRVDLSPRYVPDRILRVPSIPRTLNGKKLEVPVKKLLMGGDPGTTLNKDSLQDPSSIDYFVELASRMRSGKL